MFGVRPNAGDPLQETGRRPTAALDRNLAYPLDGVVPMRDRRRRDGAARLTLIQSEPREVQS